MRAAARLHDEVNLALLPLLGLCAGLGLTGVIDTYYVTLGLTAYILLDLIWIAFVPDALPSLPKVIMLHHIVTLVLLSFPVRYPKFGLYTCLDGLAEVNTFFLIARRRWRSWAAVHDALYWITFIPSRIILYPALLYPFYLSLRTHSLLDNVLCLGAQFLLCLFNFALLHMSVKGLRRRASSSQLAKQNSSDLLKPALSGTLVQRTADMQNSGAGEAGTIESIHSNSSLDSTSTGTCGTVGTRPSAPGLVQRGATPGPRGAHGDNGAVGGLLEDQGGVGLKLGHLHDHSAALQVDTRVTLQQPRLVAAL